MDHDHDVSRRDFIQRLSLFGVAGLGAGSLLTACGGSGDGEEGENASASDSANQGQSAEGGGGSASETVTLHPEGNQMRYRETEFTVPADTEVKLVFDNTATSPSMQHNVVILNESPSQEIFKRIGQAGVQAGSSADYVPEDPAILAATPMSKPGETVSVTFTTPSETGDYGYVCTFPGHWATMNGTMHVK